MGKGSRPRPLSIPLDEFNSRMDNIFGKKPPKEQYIPPPLPQQEPTNGNSTQRPE